MASGYVVFEENIFFAFLAMAKVGRATREINSLFHQPHGEQEHLHDVTLTLHLLGVFDTGKKGGMNDNITCHSLGNANMG